MQMILLALSGPWQMTIGAYKPHEYGLVILTMTVIKRFT